MSADYWVTVCKECRTAVCWHGEMMCWESKDADVVDVKASQLDIEKLEHPSYYSRAKLLAVCGEVREVNNE